MSILPIFGMWVDGLAAALVWLQSWLHHPQRFRLRATSNPMVLYAVGQSASDPLLVVNSQKADELPPEITQQTRGGIVEIIVPAAAVLERRLDPLPAESLPYIQNVVLHQLDSIFPWRSTDVLHATVVDTQADGKLDVSVRATTRSAIAAALAVATACGAGEVIVVAEGSEIDGDCTTGILASTGPEKERRFSRARLVAKYAVVALLLLTAAIAGWTGFVEWSLASDVAALDQAIADRHAVLKRSSELSGGGRDHELEEKKKLTPIAVIVLEELSSILPDNTYLSDLSLEGGHLRITGVSGNAVELVPLLEGSKHFKNASFYAPTTRLSATSTDRFSIEATVIPGNP